MEKELANILKKYHNESYHWALLLCHYDKDLAKDILQTSYLKILESRALFHGKSSFKTWFFAVIKHTVSDHYRKYRPLEYDINWHKIADLKEENDNSSSANLMLILMEDLSDMQRKVLQLIFYHNYTLEEAAEILEKSIGTIRTHYSRGKQRLKEIIEEKKLKDRLYER